MDISGSVYYLSVSCDAATGSGTRCFQASTLSGEWDLGRKRVCRLSRDSTLPAAFIKLYLAVVTRVYGVCTVERAPTTPHLTNPWSHCVLGVILLHALRYRFHGVTCFLTSACGSGSTAA